MRIGASPSAAQNPSAAKWLVAVTEWGLDSYLNLKHKQVFSDQEYWTKIRPDVELLKDGIPPPHAVFANNKFWGPAKQGSVVLSNGYKMKWHQIGPGRVQLRLPVTTGTYKSKSSAFLCCCYVKDDKTEKRMMANFKRHMNLLAANTNFYVRGLL